MKKLIFMITIAGLFWMSCKDKIEKVEPTPNTVKGTVIDSLTRIPLDSAWVDKDTSAPYMAYTDSLGIYGPVGTVVGYAGKYVIYCGKDGYTTRNKEVVFTGNGITAIINFELVPRSAR